MESTRSSDGRTAVNPLSTVPRRIDLADVQAASVAALIFLLPLSGAFDVFLKRHNTNLTYPFLSSTYVTPTDFLLLVVAVISIPVFRHARRHRNVATVGALGIGLALIVGGVIHPSIDGMVMLIRLVGMVGLLYIVVSLDHVNYRRALVWPLAISTALQSVLALTQTFIWQNGMTVEATIGSPGSPWTAGHGTFTEPYNLPAFLGLGIAVILVECVRSRANVFFWLTVGVSSAAIATSFGRTALLSALLVGSTYLVAWIWRRSKRFLIAGLSSLVPLALAALVLNSSWLARVAEISTVQENIRWVLARRAIDVAIEHPFVGVGPVQYGSFVLPTDGFIVHNVPLLVAAEFGILVAIAFVIWLFVLGYRSARSSPMTAAIFVYAVPYLLFDNLHYVLSVGLAMFSLWLAALARNIDPLDRSTTEAEEPVTSNTTQPIASMTSGPDSPAQRIQPSTAVGNPAEPKANHRTSARPSQSHRLSEPR